MSGEPLPVDLKKVLRERMLSLLMGKTTSSDGENSQHGTAIVEAKVEKHETIQNAFSSFLDEKRKQIGTGELLAGRTVDNDNMEQSKSTQPAELPQPTGSDSVNVAVDSDKVSASSNVAGSCHKSERKKRNDNSSSSKHRKEPSGSRSRKDKTSTSKHLEERTLSHSPTKKRVKEEPKHYRHTSESSKHESKRDSSKHRKRSRSRERSRSPRRNSEHRKERSKERKEEKKEKKSSKRRSRSRSPKHEKREIVDERNGKKKHLHALLQEMDVDSRDLEKFVEQLFGPPAAPNVSLSGSSSYRSTFKRHPSPPTRRRRPYLPPRRHPLNISSRLHRESRESSKTLSHKSAPVGSFTKQSSSANCSGTVHNNGKKTLKELTDFCRKIAEKRRRESGGEESNDESGDQSSSSGGGILMKKNAPSAIQMNIKDAKQLKVKSAAEQLQSMYPVSTGLEHLSKERDSSKSEQINPNFHKLIQRRLEAVKILTDNPNDYNALLTIEECDAKISNWATSNAELDANLSTSLQKPATSTASLPVQGPQLPPAQYTVQPSLLPGAMPIPLPWPNQDYIPVIAKSKMDIGKKLLEKQGWKEGQGLGKDLSGDTEPVLPDVKMDRKGLSCEEELQRPAVPKLTATGKHPVSMLQEICSHRRWGPPNFEHIATNGPPHRQTFVISVTVNGVKYQPTSASLTKKEAKALAATLALQSLGLLKGGPATNSQPK